MKNGPNLMWWIVRIYQYLTSISLSVVMNDENFILFLISFFPPFNWVCILTLCLLTWIFHLITHLIVSLSLSASISALASSAIMIQKTCVQKTLDQLQNLLPLLTQTPSNFISDDPSNFTNTKTFVSQNSSKFKTDTKKTIR